MQLEAARVADLQHFLMHAAKRYIVASVAEPARAEELLASAAALDYVLLMTSQHAGELLDDGGPAAASVRETLTRAAGAALDSIEHDLKGAERPFAELVERHCIFTVLRDLLDCAAVRSDDIAFRSLTLASEVMERRRSL